MYLARFSYEFLPVNRQRALDFIRREVEAAHGNGLNARLLVPLTRGHGDGAALQFKVALGSTCGLLPACRVSAAMVWKPDIRTGDAGAPSTGMIPVARLQTSIRSDTHSTMARA